MKTILALTVIGLSPAIQAAESFDAAAAFGARPSVSVLRMSPDGTQVAYLAPLPGQGNVLLISTLDPNLKPRGAAMADGKPSRLTGCNWVADNRLVCDIHGIIKAGQVGANPFPWNRSFAVDTDGHNIVQLTREENEYTRGITLSAGNIIDWLPEESGSVLMSRNYLPNDHVGSLIGSTAEGVGVDRIDTRTQAVQQIEPPDRASAFYITDGWGNVRFMGKFDNPDPKTPGRKIRYYYRTAGSREWLKLGTTDSESDGFSPIGIDHELNVVYGLKSHDGHKALYSISLDGAAQEQIVFAKPGADVDSLLYIGRRRRIVGVTTSQGDREIFAPDVKQMLDALSRALPNTALRVVDSSMDGNKMLIFATKDTDPGVYYIFDRQARKLQTFLVTRNALEGVQLAQETRISYPSSDGVMVPGFLTLPPGHTDAKGLPAIVLPHGGPSAHDEWGFDWLSQFFANRGYAVLQPEFRGSSGYGDAWFAQNGFHAWRSAISDVLAAGRWLTTQGVDPAHLGVFGWSYGGYAALQSAVVDASVFKAVIAVAPLTDLNEFKEEFKQYNTYTAIKEMVGDGPQTHEGSPLEHAAAIKAPVLLFHGDLDSNVNVRQSTLMADAIRSAHGKVELVTFEGLDHQLDDSNARTQMLRKSDEFLRKAFGMP